MTEGGFVIFGGYENGNVSVDNMGEQDFMLVSLNASDGSSGSKLWKVSDVYV